MLGGENPTANAFFNSYLKPILQPQLFNNKSSTKKGNHPVSNYLVTNRTVPKSIR